MNAVKFAVIALLSTLLFVGLVVVFYKTEHNKETFELGRALYPTVTIQYAGYGGGSGTCIYKEMNGDNMEMYFLTANHVADFSMYRQYFSPILPYFYPLYQTSKPTPVREAIEIPKKPPLVVSGWFYDENGNAKQTSPVIGTVYKSWDNIDTAIVKVVLDPKCKIANLPVAKIEDLNVFKKMLPGKKVVMSGCPYLLPALISDGHLARKSFGKKGEIPPSLDNVCLVRVNIAGGASGGGIYNFKTMKLIGLVSIGWGRNAFICGMIPISDIIPKLRKTYLGQKLGL